MGGIVMAIVECPRCGKDDVSDREERCPYCGYNIKDYYEEEKRERKRLEDARKSMEKKSVKDHEKEECKKEQMILETFPDIKKPFPWESLIGVFFGLSAIFMFNIESMIAGFFYSFLAFVLIVGGNSTYQDRKKIYETSLYDMEQAKKDAIEQQKKDKRDADMVTEKLVDILIPSSDGIMCPICKKKTGKKISTINRAVSVAAWGLASGKIAKQYKCSNCGHMW